MNLKMSEEQIERKIIECLYVSSFSKEKFFSLDKLRVQEGWDEVPFLNVLKRMSKKKFIEWMGADRKYAVTVTGILHAEEQGIISGELKSKNEEIRTTILDRLANEYESRGYTRQVTVPIEPELGWDRDVYFGNLAVLTTLGHVRTIGAFSDITESGFKFVEDQRKRKSFKDEFEKISNMAPHARGRAFQVFMAKLLEHNGWHQEESVHTSNEEIDIIINKEREYFLSECKWEKNPIEADPLRTFAGKIKDRANTNGLFFSMSGFTSGAVEVVLRTQHERLIILFGPKDISSIVNGEIKFNDLLNEKYKALVTRRKVIFE